MRRHLVALLAVLMLLMAAIPMQALAATSITTVYTSSTQKVQQGDTGKVTLKIESDEPVVRIVYQFRDKNDALIYSTVSEDILVDSGTKNYTFYFDTSSMTAGKYTVTCQLRYLSGGSYVDAAASRTFSFEVIKNECEGDHDMEDVAVHRKPTCNEPGIVLRACKDCDYAGYEEIPAAHTFDKGVLTKFVTTTLPGEWTYTCTTCNFEKVVDIPISYAINITTKPKAASAYDGEKATVSVKVSGKSLKYVWQYRDGTSGPWTTTSASSGRSSSYSLTMNKERNGRYVRCKITNIYTENPVYTTPVKLTTKFKVDITTQPENASAFEDEKATVTVKATGDDLKYQWYYKNPGSDSFAKSSITTAKCSVTMTAARDGRQMYCVVTDKYGNKETSKTVKLSMYKTAKIVTDPKNASGYANETVKFSVKATGDGLKYQWQYKNAGSSTWKNASSTSSTYSCKITKDRDGRQVRCVVTDKYGNKATSDAAKMSLAAPKITLHPHSQRVAAGNRASFTVKATGEGLKYQWQYKDADSSTWKNASSTSSGYYPTVKASHEGRKVRCVVTDKYGKKTTSESATLTLY